VHITLIEWLFLALTYVATGGAVFTEWGRQHRVLAVLAAFVAIATTGYFARDRLQEWFGLPGRPPQGQIMTADEIFWLTIKDSRATGLFEEFLKDFPSSSHAAEASNRLQLLKNQQKTMPTDTSDSIGPAPPKIQCVTFNGRQICG
jgi:hypothetical protein